MIMQAAAGQDFADCPILQADGWPGSEAGFEAALSRLWGAALPATVGDWVAVGETCILRLAPRRFWRIGGEPGLAAPLDRTGALTPLAEGRMACRLAGPGARRRLEEFIAVDWDAPACRPGRAVLAGIHRIPVCVIRLAPDRFDLIVPRSFARSVAELL